MAYYENISGTRVKTGEVWNITTKKGVTTFDRRTGRPWVQVDATQNLWVPDPLLMDDGSVMVKSTAKPKKKTNNN